MTAQNFTVDNGITVNGTGGNISGATNITASGNLTVHDATVGGNINGAGNFDIDGNASIGGNLFVTGNINFSGNVTQITGNSGVFYGNAATGVGALYAGKTGYTPVANTVLQVTGDLDDYIQVNLQNTNHGNTASMEIAITADDGDDTNNYLDMGIASSTWDGTQTNSLGTAVAARDGYLYVQGGAAGGNLILGTTTSGYGIKFNAGGPDVANTVAEISSVGITTAGVVSATGNVRGGNINTAGMVSAAGNVVGDYIIGNGSLLTGLPSGYSNADVTTLLASFGSNTVSTTGNITGGNLITAGTATVTGNVTTTGYFISGNQATGGFKLGNVNSRITAGGSNSYATFGQNIAFFPDTSASALAGIQIGGSGYLLAPNGSRVLTLSNDSSLTVTGNINQSIANTQYINTVGQISATGNITGGNLLTSGLISATGNVTGGNIRTAGLVSATGNATAGNLLTGGVVSATGNINIGTGSFVHGNSTMNVGGYSANGVGIIWPALNYNDTGTGSGTLGNSYTHVLGSPTLGFAAAIVTINNAATLYVDKPVAGSNATFGNVYAMVANGNVSVTGTVFASGFNTTNFTAANITATGNFVGNTSGYTIGYRDIPPLTMGNITIAQSDAGKHYYPSGAGLAFTANIPNNVSSSIPIGTTVMFVCQGSGNITIVPTTGVTLTFAGSGASGNRVIGAYGMATLLKVATDTWYINGAGIT